MLVFPASTSQQHHLQFGGREFPQHFVGVFFKDHHPSNMCNMYPWVQAQNNPD